MKRYLLLPGAALLMAAFVRATVMIDWDASAFALLAAGAAIVAAAAYINRRDVVLWLRDPRGVFAVTTGIAVAVFVAALVLLNMVVWYNPWSVDLTANGRNQVSEDTRRLLRRLEQPVTLRQFGRGEDARAEQLLRGFERETTRIRVEYADVDRERELAIRYGVIKLGTVVVLSGDTFRKIEDPNEQALTTAILQVTSDESRLVCFLAGHGERGLADEAPGGLSRLNAILVASNYRTQQISLLEGDVPEDCAAVVVAGARQEYSAEELDRLTAYTGRSGRIAFLLDLAPSPSFHDWLTARGIEPLDASVVDVSGEGRSVGGGARTPLALGYGSHAITREFGVATIYDGVRPLRVLEQAELGGRPVMLAQTGPRSYSTASTEAQPRFDPARGDTQGPLTLAAATALGASSRPAQQARLVVYGDSDFIANSFLARQGNRDFFLRALAWLLGEEEATVVAVDARENRRIELTEQMRAWMYIVNLGVLPLLPLTAGVIVFIRSRR